VIAPKVGINIYKESLQNIYDNNAKVSGTGNVNNKGNIIKTTDIKSSSDYIKTLMSQNLRP
jgi:hypothetical protein